MQQFDQLKWNADGLIPVIAQDVVGAKILMQAWMNKQSLQLTIKDKKATYWSRSRQCIWRKGQSSGNFQQVKEILVDCDFDCILLMVEQHGSGACHTGEHSCFNFSWNAQQQKWDKHQITNAIFSTQTLEKTIQLRLSQNNDDSYVANLSKKGIDKIMQKVGEECVESIIAAKNLANERSAHNVREFIHESADLYFHYLLAMKFLKLNSTDVMKELHGRFNLYEKTKGS